MNKTNILISHAHLPRIFWPVLVLLLVMVALYALRLMAAQSPFNPWVTFPIHQTRIASELVIDWPYAAWRDKPGSLQPSKILVKDLETGVLQDLSDDFPCQPIGSGFGDLALHVDWLVGVFSCNYDDPYEIHALNLSSRELIILPPAPGVPAEQRYAAEPTMYGDYIVWQQHNWTMSRSDLFLFDLQNQTVITLTQPPPSIVDWHPELYQDWLAWYRRNLSTGESFIRLYNLSSSEQITLPITVAQHTWVSLDDQYVVWSDWRNGDSDIYGYDLINRQEVALITGPFSQGDAVVHNGLILYHDYEPPHSLHVYHIDAQNTHFLFQQLPQHTLNRQVAIDTNIVVWQDGTSEPTIQTTIYAARPLPERFFLPMLGRSGEGTAAVDER